MTVSTLAAPAGGSNLEKGIEIWATFFFPSSFFSAQSSPDRVRHGLGEARDLSSGTSGFSKHSLNVRESRHTTPSCLFTCIQARANGERANFRSRAHVHGRHV